MKKKLYLIGIWWIWVSALARYYLSQNWEVYGSDASDSALISALKEESCDIIIWEDASRIDSSFDLVIYSEAISEQNTELEKAKNLEIKSLKYNQALAEVVNSYKLIAVAGTHGKSTTTSMISQILKNSNEDFSAIVGTLLKEFDGKNFYTRWEKNYFAIEACEYKEHFLEYRPTLAVITNIEYDHADYFKTPESYLHTFEKFIDSIVPNGFVVLDSNDVNSLSLVWRRDDLHYILVSDSYFELKNASESQKIDFPEIILHVPGKHILFDAKLAYIVAHMIGISDKIILETLEEYSGVWRRMERIWQTINGNILMSDYAHHPTEVETTLEALKSWYPDKKLHVVFQPHQYSRSIELLDGFSRCFNDADSVLIPNIYESRDTKEDMEKMTPKLFVASIEHDNVIYGEGLDATLSKINDYDSDNPDSSIILLLGAGNIDSLRYKIKTEL